MMQRSGSKGVSTRAGRIPFGPASAGQAPTAAPLPMAATPTLTEASLVRTLRTVDARIGNLLARASTAQARQDVKPELALLVQLRRILEQHHRDLPTDPVLLASVLEYTESVQAIAQDLEAEGALRLTRILNFLRELATQLTVLGGSSHAVKEQISKARGLMVTPQPDVAAVSQQASLTYTKLQQELEQKQPWPTTSWLDDLLKSTSK